MRDVFMGSQIRFEKALVGVLLGCVIFFILSKRFPEKPARLPVLGRASDILVDEMPVIRSGKQYLTPSRPVVPIPSEDEMLPEDETIDPTDFRFDFGETSLGKGLPGDPSEGVGGSGPRPIREAIPEFPESERKKGARGVVELKILVNINGRVDSVVVISNSTGSRRLAESAKNAAYRSLYRPVKDKSRVQSYWVTRPYRFESE
jgi:TonB family protein